MIKIHKSRDDDSDFINEIQWLIAGCLNQYKPTEVYIVRIRDWFDYKWCYFSGKSLGALGISKFDDLTLPPFVPNRVLAQDHYSSLQPDNGVYKLAEASPLHIEQTSETNFRRFVRRTTNDDAIIWFSSGSILAGRGSIMVYNVTPKIKFGWHVTFLKKAKWQIDKVTFTSKSLVKSLRDSGFNRPRQTTT